MAAVVNHIAESNIRQGVIGGFKFGIANALFVDANLSSAATAKAAVDTAIGKVHVSEKRWGLGVKAAIDQAENYYAGSTTGTDSTNITALSASRGRSLRF